MEVKDVARELGVKPSTVHSLIQSGRLAVTNPRRADHGRADAYLIAPSEVRRYQEWRANPESRKRARKPAE